MVSTIVNHSNNGESNIRRRLTAGKRVDSLTHNGSPKRLEKRVVDATGHPVSIYVKSAIFVVLCVVAVSWMISFGFAQIGGRLPYPLIRSQRIEYYFHLMFAGASGIFIFPMLRIILDRIVFDHLATVLIRDGHDHKLIRRKFIESSFRFVVYAVLCIAGIVLCAREGFFYDTMKCWSDFEHQPERESIVFISWYLSEMALYTHLLIYLAFDVKRKDTNVMRVHHILAIVLVSLSYVFGYMRIGSLLLIVHDFSDIFLELAKLLNYAKCQRACDMCFTLFGLVFFLTRIIALPLKISYSVVFESIIGGQQLVDADVTGFYIVSWYTFVVLLLPLQLMHIYWFAIIVRMAFKLAQSGLVGKDDRSDSEDDE